MKTLRIIYTLLYFFVISLTCNPFSAIADEDDDSWQMSAMNPIGREDVESRLKALGFGLMGDNIDRDKGTVVFNVTDVSLPGNSDLEVAIRRTAGSISYTNRQDHYMADWILEVPSVSVLTRAGYNWSNSRCDGAGVNSEWDSTTTGIDDTVGPEPYGTYQQDSWSDGMKLNIPGQGSKMLFHNNGDAWHTSSEERWPDQLFTSPTVAVSSNLIRVTTDHWLLKCGDEATGTDGVVDSDGPGRGYYVYSPNGTKYTMSRLHYFTAKPYFPLVSQGSYTNSYLLRNYATMMATKVEDVHGNWVKYDYASDGRLTKIWSNDGRIIDIDYHSGTNRIRRVTANGREWTYSYADFEENGQHQTETVKVLQRVTQPDGNYWEYDLGGLTRNHPTTGWNNDEEHTVTVKHPYGTEASYTVVDGHKQRIDYEGRDEDGIYYKVKTIRQKTLSGSSIPTSVWNYEVAEFGVGDGITETDPSGLVTKYYYLDITHGAVENCITGVARKLTSVKNYASDNGALVEEIEHLYEDSAGFGMGEGGDSEYLPSCEVYKTKSVVKRDGDTYTTEYTYDTDPDSPTYSYGKPITTTSYSNISTTPRETETAYRHIDNYWVLGLTTNVTTEGREMASFDYDNYGRLTSESKFGSEPATLTYHPGTSNLETYTDAEGHTTSAYNYHRGTPGNIYRPDGRSDEVEIDDNGWFMARKDFRGYWTNYDRDDMGRLTKIIPSKTEKSWLDTDISYSFGSEVKQTITRGNKREVITYDSYLRVIKEALHDLSGYSPTTYTATQYNASGKVDFKSFPSTQSNPTTGIEKQYDALGRLTQSRENVAPYATTDYDYIGGVTNEYGMSGHRRKVTDPNAEVITLYYDGYSGPEAGKLLGIKQPLGVYTELTRNTWGQVTRLRQRGEQNGYSEYQDQFYYYDEYQRLCRHRTGEGGDTLYEYDLIGNITAYQKGASYGETCATPSGSGLVTMEYDSLGQVEIKNFAHSSTPDISYDYDFNGNVTGVHRNGVDWTYTYDELNNLTSEELAIDGRNFSIDYEYDTSEVLERRTLPTGRSIIYNNDGRGRPKSVTNQGVYLANKISYNTNGSIKYMDMASGNLRYGQWLNARMLPRLRFIEDQSDDEDLWDVERTNYDYDVSGNVTEIDELTPIFDKSLEYDALNRLTGAIGQWGSGSYTYDALGNLRSKNLGGRQIYITYDSSTNRPDGYLEYDGEFKERSMDHDARGNVTRLADIDFEYDYSDQPVQVTGEVNGSYKYDGNNKRVKAVVDDKVIYYVYSLSGELVYVDKYSDSQETEYVHVNGKTLAQFTNGVVTYFYTDLAGSPLAGFNANGQRIWREDYTPFGEKFIDVAANDDLAGFTGHVDDSATGLTYMQARYYDPTIGRFLSVDPVRAFEHLHGTQGPQGFNRYAYVNNNPYKFSDSSGAYAEYLNRSPLAPDEVALRAESGKTGMKVVAGTALMFTPGPEDVVLGVAAVKAASKLIKGSKVTSGVENVSEFMDHNATRLNKKLGRKIGEGRLPFERSREGMEKAKQTIEDTLQNSSATSKPFSNSNGDKVFDVFSEKTGFTVRIREDGVFDTLIDDMTDKF